MTRNEFANILEKTLSESSQAAINEAKEQKLSYDELLITTINHSFIAVFKVLEEIGILKFED